MITSNSLLLSSTHNIKESQELEYYPPSPPLSTSVSYPRSPMSKASILASSWSSSPQQQQHTSSTKSISAEISSFLNLEKVVQTYGNQPELLELILSSKVEEDRRRAEEAKLRRKEIDYLLQNEQTPSKSQPQPQRQQQLKRRTSDENLFALLPPIATKHFDKRESSFSSTTSKGSIDSTLPRLHHRTKSYSHQYDTVPSFSTTWKNSNTPRYQPTFKSAAPSSLVSPPPKRRKSSSIEMLLSPSPRSMDLKLPELSSLSHLSTSNTNLLNHRPPSPSSKHSRSSFSHYEEQGKLAAGSAPLSPPTESNANVQPVSGNKPLHAANKRRRREMQAITTIIETKEFPYNDDYLWKNNGNTVHKKTGFKSIYYKCSNSGKGCPVNKTVTFKDNGEHLIKYRGQHLPECNRIKRITDL